ncbi:HigA family addiction module antitoxin [Georgenia sp. MJ170]|uniref:HigA family addiction module antitoxin n=1 Tax=Georgenia sunbinii TaxID=3117728 RepID=UPI002F25F28F
MSAPLAEIFPVGEMLADELDARGWTQVEFAEVLGRPAQFVSEILTGKKEITRDSATQIAAALGTSPEMWLKMQDRYHLWRQAQDGHTREQLSDVRLRARLKDLAPVGVMRQRGLIKGATPSEQEREIKELYGIDDINDEPEILVAARRSKANEKVSSTQLAWVACVRRGAEGIDVGEFNREALEDLASRLTRLITKPEDFASLPSMFAEVGVRLVFVEAFPGSKMDGCSSLFGTGGPVIGISGRGKRLDKVLFTLLHEVAHIHLGHLDKKPLIIDDQGESPTLGLEGPANDLAASWVLPEKLPALPERVNQGWVTAVAASQGIHPIVLIGRLQNEGRIPWRTTLVRDAPSVLTELAKW